MSKNLTPMPSPLRMWSTILLVALTIVVAGFLIGVWIVKTGLLGTVVLIVLAVWLWNSPVAIWGAFLGARNAINRRR